MPHDAACCAYQSHQRLKNTAQFRRVFNSQKPFFHRHFVVHSCLNDCGHARLGVVVSKKVSKKAVVRNQIKRQVRNAFRLCANELPAMDIVVVARSSCANSLDKKQSNKVDLQADIQYIFAKISAKIQRQKTPKCEDNS